MKKADLNKEPDLFANEKQAESTELKKTGEEPAKRKTDETRLQVQASPKGEAEMKTKESSDGTLQKGKCMSVSDSLPAVLADGLPAEDGGELSLARYAARAYLEYALSVVKSRALPDVFDGMKPVQRRILYAMDRMRLAPPAKVVKCARVVGDVLGKYHPHGDQAAYEAMVRMAQDFTLRYPLIDGQGNFGSRDGDGPAAMRYTEARLTKISELLLSELDMDDVDFIPNYDGSFKEPVLLPAKLPFVLLNGASGIAVGMATEIPPHNLTEVAQAVLLLLKKPDATLEEVLSVLPAPDYPGGGQIISSSTEIRQIYESGRGSLKVRARYHFEDLQRGQWQLVIDELPPAASAEMVLSQIEELTNPKPKAGKKTLTSEQQQTKAAMLALLDGVRNECDKDTKMRLVFEPKTSKIDRDLFVNTLLAQTSLECNAPMNLVMIGTDGRPRQKGLLEILHEWVEARRQTVRRRTEVRLSKVNARLHILQGRCIAIDNIDRVIEIVRFEEHPRDVLMTEFSLTEQQAEDILELRLRQLANLEFERIEQEMSKLKAERESLEDILDKQHVLTALVAKETKEAAKLYGDQRRTLIEQADKAVIEAPVVTEPVTVVISEKGFIRARSGHGHDASLMNYKMGDKFAKSIECTTDDMLIVIGSNGRVYSIAVSRLPSARGDGLPVTSFVDFEAGTDVIGYVAGPLDTRVVLTNSAGFGLMCSIKDMVARVRAGKAFMRLDEGAQMLTPRVVGETDRRLACLSEEGRLLVFDLSELRVLSGGGKGVTLMELNPGEKLLDALSVPEDGCVVQGQGRSTTREKTLVKADWMRHWGKRARKGKTIEIRFVAQTLTRLVKNADGSAVASQHEEEPEPTLI